VIGYPPVALRGVGLVKAATFGLRQKQVASTTQRRNVNHRR